MIRKLFSKLMGAKKPKSKKPARKPTKRSSPRPKSRSKPKAKARKPAAAKRKPAKKKTVSKKAEPAGDQLGEVVAFFRIPVVAVIKIRHGSLKIGDQIWIKGHTTDLKQAVTSMQVNHQPIRRAGKGDEFGLKISSRARRGDRVYRINP